MFVERDPRHAFAPSLLRAMTDDRRPGQVVRDGSTASGLPPPDRRREIAAAMIGKYDDHQTLGKVAADRKSRG